MLLILLGSLTAAWALVTIVIVGACASAARGDRDLLASVNTLAGACGAAPEIAQTLPPRVTWRAVRTSTLTSSQSDQLATYR